ncbi:MAG: TonB-dependent receptor [Alistipes sp.]|nr:TonB-dependent receptor [Candidatus Alistipes equi]
MVKKILLSIAAVLALSFIAGAQTKQVAGTVVGEDGSPIVGATVVVDGTTNGTSTDASGNFVLAAPAQANLLVSFIGYTDTKVAVNGKTFIKVVLKEGSKAIDDVIVVAFGESKKEAFTGSAAVIKSDDISKVQSTNVTSALTGKVAGVQISSTSGDLSAQPSIMIRGVGSINAGTEPLWVVDGMPYDGDLNNLNTADIETMTVLKDAASNALYGSRGANGVIMVTTKRAKLGDAQVSLDAKWGVNDRALQEYEVLKNPAQYYETHFGALYRYYNQNYDATAAYALANAGLITNGTGGLGYNVFTVPAGQNLIGTNGKLNPSATVGRVVDYNGEKYLLTPDDWMKEAYKKGFRQEYNVNVSAATQRSNVYASFGYINNEGLIKGSQMERYTARLKGETQAKKWLKVGGNMAFSHFTWSNGNSSEGESNATTNIFAFATNIAPIYPVYIRNVDGSIKIDQNGLPMYDYGNKGNAGLTRATFPGSNALQTSWLNKSLSNGNSFDGHGFFDINIYKGLKLTVNGGTSIDQTRSNSVLNPFYGQFAEGGGSVSVQDSRFQTYNLQQILNYNETFGKHTVGLMLGHEYYDRKQYVLYASHSKMSSYTNPELAGAIKDSSSSSSYVTEYNTEGYFLRGQYDFDGRIFVSGSYRRDASSKFSPDHRWGNFWSVGAAWLLNKESWFNASWVDLLKVKASYGSQGNDGIGSYLYTDTYSIENNNGEVSYVFQQKGSPTITWETNKNFNVGVEFGFFKNRLTGSIEYFNRKTTDMLFSFKVPETLGYSSYYANIGDMSNKGIEIVLNADLIRTKNVNWNFGINMTYYKNKVTKLADDYKTQNIGGYPGYINGSYYVAEGLPLYSFYMCKSAGVNPENGAAQWYYEAEVKDADGNVIGTETKITEDYTIANQKGKYLSGDATPSLYGGFNTSIEFYGFDIAAAFTYQIGGLTYDGGYAQFMSSPYGTTVGGNYHKDQLKAWTPENPNSTIPRLQYGDQYTSSTSDRFLVDASYLNIQNINVGYTLPRKLTSKIGISRLRVYLACDNVYYWSYRKGLDPRQSFSGGTNFTTYAPIRTISGGLNVVF